MCPNQGAATSTHRQRSRWEGRARTFVETKVVQQVKSQDFAYISLAYHHTICTSSVLHFLHLNNRDESTVFLGFKVHIYPPFKNPRNQNAYYYRFVHFLVHFPFLESFWATDGVSGIKKCELLVPYIPPRAKKLQTIKRD